METVTVSVPRERLGEFYALLSQFFGSKAEEGAQTEAAGSQPQRIAGEAGPPQETVTGKYAPLFRFFLNAPGEELVMSFSQMEDALGGKLPPSARKHRPCWANSQVSLLGRVWLRAGWRLAEIDLEDEVASFERQAQSKNIRRPLS